MDNLTKSFLDTDTEEKLRNAGLELVSLSDGLSLTDGNLVLKADFESMQRRLVQKNLEQELLVKAVRIKGKSDGLKVVDATAGFGEDSILLGAAGFDVLMFEKDAVIASLLLDALNRKNDDIRVSNALKNLQLRCEDSIEAMKSGELSVDVIYLDPMFPERNKSAKIGKKFQLLQRLERPCDNEVELFEAALLAAPKKIVVKRPLKGPYLAGVKPSYSLSGKAIRYDCHIFAR